MGLWLKTFEEYLEKSGPKVWINNYNCKKVQGGFIFTYKQPEDPMRRIIGFGPMVIVEGNEDVLWTFQSSVSSSKVETALSKENSVEEWLNWPQKKLIRKVNLK